MSDTKLVLDTFYTPRNRQRIVLPSNCCGVFVLSFLTGTVSNLAGILGVKTQNITNNTTVTCILGTYENGTFLHRRLKKRSREDEKNVKNNFKRILLYHWHLTLLFPQKFHLFLHQY